MQFISKGGYEMKNIRKVILTFLTLILVLNLSACHSSSTNAKRNVNTFITELRDAKSVEYVSQVYRKYLYTGDGKRTIITEMETRQGMIQFEPQVFLEVSNSNKGKLDDFPASALFEEELITIGTPYRLDHGGSIYSPSKGVTYTGYVNKQKQFEWRKAEDWSYVREVEAPKLGRNEEFLKLYETYSDKFTRSEDNQFVYLEFNGDVKDNLDLIEAFHSSVFESNMFVEPRDNITAVDIQIKLVMEKVKKGNKLIPSEAKIILTTSLENKEEKWTAKSEDHFEYYYRNLNNVEEIKKPEGVTLK